MSGGRRPHTPLLAILGVAAWGASSSPPVTSRSPRWRYSRRRSAIVSCPLGEFWLMAGAAGLDPCSSTPSNGTC
ncbi:hypothetical protein ACIBQ6_37575 [Nonomuraea sp. NPDC049655]|uniref:hypothetical protein n=1 Tax=Nonomuraea sp. NPDC049655 TaxID=3364355 RepID=UPI003788123A